MEKSSPRPTLFTKRGLELTTKGIAIYAAFNIIVVFAKIMADKANMSALVPDGVLYPYYGLLAIYLFMTLLNGWFIFKGKYYWLVAIASIIILLACRFYYLEMANWIYANAV
ncbi:MAG: hypothetical protein NWQ09_04025 [Nonlabens sp.]|nr:hypothetical protein [Nonlabens sp.]